MKALSESQYHEWAVELAHDAPEPESPPNWLIEMALAAFVTLMWLIAVGGAVDLMKEVLR